MAGGIWMRAAEQVAQVELTGKVEEMFCGECVV